MKSKTNQEFMAHDRFPTYFQPKVVWNHCLPNRFKQWFELPFLSLKSMCDRQMARSATLPRFQFNKDKSRPWAASIRILNVGLTLSSHPVSHSIYYMAFGHLPIRSISHDRPHTRATGMNEWQQTQNNKRSWLLQKERVKMKQTDKIESDNVLINAW